MGPQVFAQSFTVAGIEQLPAALAAVQFNLEGFAASLHDASGNGNDELTVPESSCVGPGTPSAFRYSPFGGSRNWPDAGPEQVYCQNVRK